MAGVSELMDHLVDVHHLAVRQGHVLVVATHDDQVLVGKDRRVRRRGTYLDLGRRRFGDVVDPFGPCRLEIDSLGARAVNVDPAEQRHCGVTLDAHRNQHGRPRCFDGPRHGVDEADLDCRCEPPQPTIGCGLGEEVEVLKRCG